jgi:hypothetical protein
MHRVIGFAACHTPMHARMHAHLPSSVASLSSMQKSSRLMPKSTHTGSSTSCQKGVWDRGLVRKGQSDMLSVFCCRHTTNVEGGVLMRVHT